MLDRTGLVSGLAIPSDLEDGRLAPAVPPEVGLTYWPAPSVCTHRIAMVFERAGADEFRLRVKFDVSWGGSGCASDMVGRWVLIRLTQPVPAEQVREIVESG